MIKVEINGILVEQTLKENLINEVAGYQSYFPFRMKSCINP